MVLVTLTDRALIDQVCAALESAEIAVLLEHVEIINSNVSASGVRILVPSHCTERAMKLIASIGGKTPRSERVYH